MSKNHAISDSTGIQVHAVVPVGTSAGDIVLFGDLTAVALTDRHNAADYGHRSIEYPAHGLKDGEASLKFPDLVYGTYRTATSAMAVGDPVYMTPGGQFTKTSSGNTMVGYALTAGTDFILGHRSAV